MEIELLCIPTSNLAVRFLSYEEIVLRNPFFCYPNCLIFIENNLLMDIKKQWLISSSRPGSLLTHLAF